MADVSWVYSGLAVLTAASAIFAVALAALQRWVAFLLFLAVYVVGATALTVQVVLSS